MDTNDATQRHDVRNLSTLRRRYHLEHLLETRYELAVAAVEQLSHNLDGANELFDDLLIIEDEIRDQFPQAYTERWPKWVDDDAKRLHGPGVLVADCSLCTQIAAAVGLNLEEPEAA